MFKETFTKPLQKEPIPNEKRQKDKKYQEIIFNKAIKKSLFPFIQGPIYKRLRKKLEENPEKLEEVELLQYLRYVTPKVNEEWIPYRPDHSRQKDLFKEGFDHRGQLNNPEDQKIWDVNFNETRKILKALEKKGTKKTIRVLTNEIANPSKYHKESLHQSLFSTHEKELIDVFDNIDNLEGNYTKEKIIENLKKEKLPDQIIFEIIIILSDWRGAEELRDCINKAIEEEQDQTAKDNLLYAQSFLTPNHDKAAITNLQKFYQERIKFEEYDVNQKMNEKEVALLEELIEKDEKVLEMGCGTGRLLLEMQKKGFDISGYDFTERHVEHIKEKNPKTDVFQGDWHNNALKDESFETVYSLGRNILHDYSLVDQVELFREANRILKPGGKFIFDIPNREKGGYKMMVEEYTQEMENRGIQNFRYGAIYDSPDGENFATRYVYSHEDIIQLAQISGFRVKEIKKIPLETGKDDENLYYVLEKIR